MKKTNLTEPLFESSRERDDFIAIVSLHHLITTEDILWLLKFEQKRLAYDVKTLVFTRKSGIISKFDSRAITGAEIINASPGLRRLTDLGLILMLEKGKTTYYTPTKALLEK
ncbi:MAG: hypothetical protein WCF90_02155 [Methanomicrobiales archaeon]